VKKLIINADDFGLHEEINNGIIRCFQEGCLTSTSLMCGAPAFEHAVALLKKNSTLGVGVHLTLVGGVAPVLPVDEVTSLVDENGLFFPDYKVFIKKFYLGQVKKIEIKRELEAQLFKAIATGLKFTHVDSHQHLHVLPGIVPIVISLCRQFDIHAVRLPGERYSADYGYKTVWSRKLGKNGLTFCSKLAARQFTAAGLLSPDQFFGMLSGGNLSIPVVQEFLSSLKEGTGEIMTHPGNSQNILRQLYPWGYHWEQERNIFINENIKKEIAAQHISLINFGGLTYE
jgi:hopanoid biosynthesis associated protein HpnK